MDVNLRALTMTRSSEAYGNKREERQQRDAKTKGKIVSGSRNFGVESPRGALQSDVVD